MMSPCNFFILLIPVTVFSWSVLYLLKALRRDRQIIALIGLFCMAMGLFLLLLDLVLVALLHGIEYIPDYLLFNRLVSDSGFAGRWVLTVYLFSGTGFLISIYLLARNLFAKFNIKKNGKNP